MLSVRGLGFRYQAEPVLKNVNMRAWPGEIISLLGPNGSGKSTLLRCLAGLMTPRQGEIFLKGRPVKAIGRRELARHLSFLPQGQEPVQHVTVWELVARGRSPYHAIGWVYSRQDRDIISWALDYMQLSHLQHRHVNSISGGERQRAWVAMILAQDTDLVLLDEPVTYLDLKHQWDLLEVIRALKKEFSKTVITVFHDINHALAVSDRVYLLKEGEVFTSGVPEEVITGPVLRRVFGVYAQVCRVQCCCRPVVIPIGGDNVPAGEDEIKIDPREVNFG